LFIRDNLLSHTPNTVLKGLVEVHTLAITPNSCKEGTQEKHFFVLQKTAEDVIGDECTCQGPVGPRDI
jgi:hypothetical protein